MTHPMYIGGRPSSGTTTADVRNPWNDSVVGTVAQAGPDEAERAIVCAAKGASESRRCSAFARSEALHKIADELRRQKDDFASLITAETGKPIQFARGEVDRAVFTFTLAAEEAKRIGGEVLPLDLQPSTENRFALTRRFPIGIVLCIAPFNFPLNLVAHKIAPAIAAGNSFILKPAPQAPLTSLLLGDLLVRSGYPLDAINILPCTTDVAESLVRDDRIAMVSFTGSAAVGWHLKSIAGRKKILLELGGNAGVIVDADAKIEDTAKKNAYGAFVSAGQVCIKVQRIFVLQQIFDDYLTAFGKATRDLVCGDPQDPATVVGPLINDGAAERIERWISEAVAGGAQVLEAGTRVGRVMSPAVIVNAPADCRAVREELFGPVALIQRVQSFDEAIDLVNASKFGLQAGVFSNSFKNIMHAFESIDVGAVIVNDNPTFRIDHMPYGGVKHSGFGREGVKYAIDAMTEPRLLVIA